MLLFFLKSKEKKTLSDFLSVHVSFYDPFDKDKRKGQNIKKNLL
jgi:hypothetical protein